MNTIDGSDPVIINHSINLNHSNTKKQQSNSNNNSSRELKSSESSLNKMKYKEIQNSFDIRDKELNDKHLKDLQLSRNFIRGVNKHKEYYIENQLIPAVSRMMEPLGYDKERLMELSSNERQQSLDAFF